MSAHSRPPSPRALDRDQALIPENYKKSLESRALLEHYQAAQMRKAIDGRIASDERSREMEFSKMQNECHQREIERRRIAGNSKKEEYSREYQQMIEMRREREKAERERELWLEQQMLRGQNWLLDPAQQKQIQKLKKLQYGKQLEKHLKMQEQRRISEANKIKQQRERMKREAQEAVLRQQQQKEARLKRRSVMEYRQSDVMGVKGALNWSTHQMEQQQKEGERALTPRMDRMLKVQHQKYYEKGAPAQYKSQNLRRYYQRYQNANPQAGTQSQQAAYNPITNPIPFKYKNPNILRLLSDYS